MTQLNTNGNSYSDDGSTSRDMRSGGHRTWLLAMISDLLNDMAGKLATAANAVTSATQQATNAATSAATAVSAPGTSATSTTSLTIGMGPQTLTIQTGKSIVQGMQVIIANTAAPTNWMAGTVTAYNSVTGALTVQITNYSGTANNVSTWTISLAGAPGVAGVLNELKGAPIASAATVNLDAATGNLVHITGNVQISSIQLAAGSERTVIFDGTPLLTHNAAAIVVPGASSLQVQAGDRMIVRGDGNGVVLVIDYVRANGQAVVSLGLGANSQTIAANTQLAIASSGPAVQVLTPQGPGASVALPDATKSIIGLPFNHFQNASTMYQLGMRDNGGTLRFVLEPGAQGVTSLASNANAAGQWLLDADVQGAALRVSENVIAMPASITQVFQVVPLSATTHIIIGSAGAGTNAMAVVYDANTNTFGLPVLLWAWGNGPYIPATGLVALSATQAIYGYQASANFVSVLMTVSNTTQLTISSPTQTAWAGGTGPCQLAVATGATSAVFALTAGTSTATSLVGVAINGAATVNGALVTPAGAQTNPWAQIAMTGPSTGWVLYGNNGGASPTAFTAVAFSVNQQTVTLGSSCACCNNGANAKTLQAFVNLPGTTKWAQSYTDSTGVVSVSLITLAANVPSANDLAITASGNQTSANNLVAWSSNKLLIYTQTAAYVGTLAVFNENNGTLVNAGITFTITSSNGGSVFVSSSQFWSSETYGNATLVKEVSFTGAAWGMSGLYNIGLNPNYTPSKGTVAVGGTVCMLSGPSTKGSSVVSSLKSGILRQSLLPNVALYNTPYLTTVNGAVVSVLAPASINVGSNYLCRLQLEVIQ